MTREKWAVVSDFDGTISQKDVADEICFHFKTATRADIQRSYDPAVKVEDWVAASFGAITAPRPEVEKFIFSFARPRAGARELGRCCRENGIPFEVASGGLDIYIAPLMKRWGLGDVTCHCGRVNDGKPSGYTVSYAHLLKNAPALDEFKAHIVRGFQQRGYKVVFCGDGTSDFKAAIAADAVFARYKLAKRCAAAGRKTRRLGSFDAVIKFLMEKRNAS